jgi:hypothetical protein
VLVPPPVATVGRAFHPLRLQRWAISDLNPWLAPLKGIAEVTKANRVTREETGPSAATEHWLASNIVASWDLYRQLRDAAVENLFSTSMAPSAS